LAFNHKKESSLIFSTRTKGVDTIFLKVRLLRSFQITQTQANQMTLKNEWVPRGMPAMQEHWIKWSRIWRGCTTESPTQFQTWSHKAYDISHSRKRWLTVSDAPHPDTHSRSFTWIILRRKRLSFVGIRLRKRHYTNRDTFSGICLCQTWTRVLCQTLSLICLLKHIYCRTKVNFVDHTLDYLSLKLHTLLNYHHPNYHYRSFNVLPELPSP